MKLYEITGAMLPVVQAYQDATTQEELDALAEQLQSLELTFQEKALAVSHYCLNIKADIDARKNEMARLKAKNDVAERAYESLKNYLHTQMVRTGQTRIESATAIISFRKSSSVIVDDAEKVPNKYKRAIIKLDSTEHLTEILAIEPGAKVETEVKKVEIKEVNKQGIGVEGTHIETKHNIQIT